MSITERTRTADAPGRAIADAISWDPLAPKVAAIFIAFVLGLACYYAFVEAPTAIKHDMSEAYAWGQEFQLGYNQHPPFWAWLCALWFEVFPHTQWAFGLLSALNAGVGLLGAWHLIGDFARGPKRAAAWALLILTPLYTAYAYKSQRQYHFYFDLAVDRSLLSAVCANPPHARRDCLRHLRRLRAVVEILRPYSRRHLLRGAAPAPRPVALPEVGIAVSLGGGGGGAVRPARLVAAGQ